MSGVVVEGGTSALTGSTVAGATAQFATVIDSGVLYGTPTLDDYIYGRSKINRDAALQVPAIKKARDLICNGIGQLPLVMYDAEGKAVDWALLTQLEAGTARSVSVTRIIEDMLLDARAWLRTTQVGWHGLPAEVVRLDADTVTVQPKLVSYGYGTATVWPTIPGLTRIDSPNAGLLSLGRAIRTLILLESAGLRHVEGAPPVDYFTPADSTVEPEDAEVVELLAAWKVARQANATGYVPAALKYNIAGWNPEQLQLIEAREFAITEIARLTGIDAEELSVSTTSRTYFNGQDRGRERVRNILGPYMRAFEERMSMDDITPPGFAVKFDPSAYLQLDDLQAAQADEILVRSKIITPDEARAKRGLEPLGEPATQAVKEPADVA